MQVFVEFECSECGAVGEGFREASEVGCAEDCWQCGKQTYYGASIDDEEEIEDDEEDCDE